MHLLQLTPNLMVRDVTETVKFYCRLFGFEIQYLIEEGGESNENFDTDIHSDKTYQYAGLINGSYRLGLQTQKSIHTDIPEIVSLTKPVFSGSLYIEIESLAAFKNLLTDQSIREVPRTWYGMHEIYLQDPNGYILCVATKTPKPKK